MSNKQIIKFKEPPLKSKVWRYMDFAKFFDLLTKSKLFFVRLDKLADQLEGTLTPNCIDEIRSRFERPEFLMSKREIEVHTAKEISHIEKFRSYTLVNCWSQNAEESLALWKIYLGNQPYGVSIQTTYQNLKNSIADPNYVFKYRKVYYSNKVKELDQPHVNFRKNNYYRFENEIRIAIENQYVKFGGDPKYKIGTYVDVDLSRLIKKLYISPFSPDWFCDLVKSLVLNNLKCSIPIVRSKIQER